MPGRSSRRSVRVPICIVIGNQRRCPTRSASKKAVKKVLNRHLGEMRAGSAVCPCNAAERNKAKDPAKLSVDTAFFKDSSPSAQNDRTFETALSFAAIAFGERRRKDRSPIRQKGPHKQLINTWEERKVKKTLCFNHLHGKTNEDVKNDGNYDSLMYQSPIWQNEHERTCRDGHCPSADINHPYSKTTINP